MMLSDLTLNSHVWHEYITLNHTPPPEFYQKKTHPISTSFIIEYTIYHSAWLNNMLCYLMIRLGILPPGTSGESPLVIVQVGGVVVPIQDVVVLSLNAITHYQYPSSMFMLLFYVSFIQITHINIPLGGIHTMSNGYVSRC